MPALSERLQTDTELMLEKAKKTISHVKPSKNSNVCSKEQNLLVSKRYSTAAVAATGDYGAASNEEAERSRNHPPILTGTSAHAAVKMYIHG